MYSVQQNLRFTTKRCQVLPNWRLSTETPSGPQACGQAMAAISMTQRFVYDGRCKMTERFVYDGRCKELGHFWNEDEHSICEICGEWEGEAGEDTE